MNKNNFLIAHFILIVVSIAIIIFLYPDTHQTGGLYLPVPKEEIQERVKAMLESLQLDTDDRTLSSNIRVNRGLYTQTLQEYGISEGNRMLRRSIPAFYWDFRWTGPETANTFTVDGGDEVITLDGQLQSAIRLRLDGYAQLIRFNADIADTIYIASVDADSALSIGEEFLINYTQYNPDTLTFLSHREQTLDNRVDHTFRWETTSGDLVSRSTIEVTVAGSVVSHYNLEFDTPRTGLPSTQETLSILSSSIPYVLLGIMMLVIGVKRLRSHEIGFRNGVIMGIIAGVLVGINLYLQLMQDMQLMMLIPLILGPITIGAFVAFVIIVSEAVGRHTWKEKFIPFDLVTNGHILHSAAGKSYVRGITYGITAFALSLIAILSVDAIHPLWYTWIQANPLENYSPPFPAVKILMNDIWMELIAFSVMVLFVLSYLRQRISNVPVLLISAAVLYGIMDWSNTFPALGGILIATVYALFFIWIVYKYDVISGFLAVLTFSLSGAAATLLFSGNDYYLTEGIFIASLFGIVFIAGIASQFTRDRITDYEEIAPVFQKYISERERLQRELEIAHDVQMSFLPKKKPAIPALDVASTCIPAHEVGGDYYDFININDHLFGIVIGDVSGKGTKASFYMTLTKGILRSTARNETDPAEVLRKVNRTFYESAERGAFISMVYGIFDLQKKTLTVARAGHNPVILWKSAQANGEMINPKGIALGLDNGQVFDTSIQEKTVAFEPGDVFIFYTDGFSEAANKRNEEFGDDRLFETAQKYHQSHAEEILNGIVSETNQFTGRTPQRDDMTMVIVKVIDE